MIRPALNETATDLHRLAADHFRGVFVTVRYGLRRLFVTLRCGFAGLVVSATGGFRSLIGVFAQLCWRRARTWCPISETTALMKRSTSSSRCRSSAEPRRRARSTPLPQAAGQVVSSSQNAPLFLEATFELISNFPGQAVAA